MGPIVMEVRGALGCGVGVVWWCGFGSCGCCHGGDDGVFFLPWREMVVWEIRYELWWCKVTFLLVAVDWGGADYGVDGGGIPPALLFSSLSLCVCVCVCVFRFTDIRLFGYGFR